MTKAHVDTNILLRLILQDDKSLLKKAKRLIDNETAGACIVATAVIAEVFYVLRQMGFARDAAAGALQNLLEFSQFSYDELVAEQSIELYKEAGLDFVDCHLAIRASSSSERLKTLDKKLQKTYEKISAAK